MVLMGVGRFRIVLPSVCSPVGPREAREHWPAPPGPVLAHPPVSLCSLSKPRLRPRAGRPFPADKGLEDLWASFQPWPLTVCDCVSCTVAPSAPGRVLVSRDTRTSVVVEWDRPKKEEDLLGYYVDCCVAGTSLWEPCNHKPIGYNRCGRLPAPWGPDRCPGAQRGRRTDVGEAVTRDTA